MANNNVRFVTKNGLDNNGNSIVNIGVSGATLTQAGANSLTLTTTGTTNVTFPTSGTLATTTGSITTATNIAGGAANSIPYQTGSGTTTFLAQGTGILQETAGTPSWTTTPTLTGTNFTGIPNAGLTNSSITIGSTGVSLGSTATTLAGLTSVTSTTFIGALTGHASSDLALTGGSMSGTVTFDSIHTVTGLPTPVNTSDATPKSYVDAAISGLEWKQSAAAASTAALTVTYSNGSSGVGATLTNAGTQAAFAIDGYTASLNDRILIKNQASVLQNGIYSVTTLGSGSTNWVLTRTTDANTSTELNNATLYITNGTVNTNTVWTQTTANPIVGTSSITFAQFSSGSTTATALSGTATIPTVTPTTSGVFAGTNSTIPEIFFTNSSATANQRTWGLFVDNQTSTGLLTLASYTDALAQSQVYMTIDNQTQDGNAITFSGNSFFVSPPTPISGTAAGGLVSIMAGNGGGTSGKGGYVQIIGGNSVSGGSGTGTNGSGAVALLGGSATTSGSNSVGGTVTILGGATGSSTGGNVNITSGGVISGSTTGTAGNITIKCGSGGTTSAGAGITLQAGAGGSTSGNGGSIILNAGSVSSGTAGSIQFQIAGTTYVTINNAGNIVASSASNTTPVINATSGYSLLNITNATSNLYVGADVSGSIFAGQVASIVYEYNNIPLIFGTNNNPMMILDQHGTTGISIIPNVWGNAGGLQVPGRTNTGITSMGTGLQLYDNAYFNSSWKYSTSAAASGYQQSGGTHTWLSAVSGTVNNAISYTTIMTADTNGPRINSGSLGYGTGTGGTVTQATSRTNGVTLNKSNGAITLFSTTTTAGLINTFTVTNSIVAATDTIILSQKSGSVVGPYILLVTAVAAGSFNITIYTPNAVVSADAPVINFAVIKAVTA